MAKADKPDLSRTMPVWVDGDHTESRRLCRRDDCRNAGKFRVACTLHTKFQDKEDLPC